MDGQGAVFLAGHDVRTAGRNRCLCARPDQPRSGTTDRSTVALEPKDFTARLLAHATVPTWINGGIVHDSPQNGSGPAQLPCPGSGSPGGTFPWKGDPMKPRRAAACLSSWVGDGELEGVTPQGYQVAGDATPCRDKARS